jgi:hypothetical protein
MSERYSTRIGEREGDDVQLVFRPVFTKIAELYDGIKFFDPASGPDIYALLGVHARRGKADATIGTKSGMVNSLMEFEFKSGRWALSRAGTLGVCVCVCVCVRVCVCVCVCARVCVCVC